MQSVTIQQILDWKPCEGYNKEYIEALFDGRKVLDPMAIACLEIPSLDRIWALLNMMSSNQQIVFGIECIRSAFQHIQKNLPVDAKIYLQVMSKVEEIALMDKFEPMILLEVHEMINEISDKHNVIRGKSCQPLLLFRSIVRKFGISLCTNMLRWHPYWCMAYDCELIASYFDKKNDQKNWFSFIIDRSVDILG